MNHFYSIPTDSFVPLSHDNAYLFNHYDKLANFLSLHLDKKYRHMLAKPIKSNFDIHWYSPYDELLSIESSAVKENAQRAYWDFYTALESKILELGRQDNDNTRDWVSLLKKVFNPENNLLFTNGSDISIIWGWKFENNQIGRPDLLQNGTAEDEKLSELNEFEANSDRENDRISVKPKENTPADEPAVPIEDDFWSDRVEPPPMDLPAEEVDNLYVKPPLNHSFLAFLKYFAGRYWWLLIILLVLIAFVFMYKSVTI
ncbi:hypothetical protein FAZ19_09870 [Sphingobacterium alkalisoli]|uniref:Uncharacterized protein n=1 Tax=Sphingobacterium alkalisoli TaxID=1874115 RepID=A0A4U0H1K3_9SPHI|nr:hypothetical protein [Sphingobacterium alkalisoli]TJY65443.1 hypothetical protein FAZ19_09870 [Sphingobacterium alkalisoli]GGH20427.1 hypothetical protein GCM10011418_25620 [Sphingobacterium alkalisoli]